MTVKKYIKGLDGEERDRYEGIRERFHKKNRYQKQAKKLRLEQYYDDEEY